MFAVNKETYNDLIEQLNKDDMVPWILRNNLLVHPIINKLFEHDKFLQHVLFDTGFNILNEVIKDRYGRVKVGEIPESYFDHYHAVQFKDTFNIGVPEIVGGVMNFPYLHCEKEIKKFITNAPANWEVYLINPVLMNYGSAIGFFLTPEYCNGAYIDEVNNYIRLKTGYPLFLRYAFDNFPNIEPITYTEVEKDIDEFISRFNHTDNKGLQIMLEFWRDNDCVSCDSFEYSYKNYLNNQSFSIYKNINFKKIESTVPFKITLTKPEMVLGGFKKFHLDCGYMLADTDIGEFPLFDEEMQALIDGDYTIEFISEDDFNTLKKAMIKRTDENYEEHLKLSLNCYRKNPVKY